MQKVKKGFTLIELLVVIAIIAVLATVVFVALNPAKRLADARNSRRFSDVSTILTAIHQCIVDEKGVETNCGNPTTGTVYEIVETGIVAGCDDVCTDATADTSCLVLDGATMQKYMKELPVDSQNTTSGHTGYQLLRDANGIYTITACHAESPESYGAGADTVKAIR